MTAPGAAFSMHSTLNSLIEASEGGARNVFLPSAYFVASERILAGISNGRPNLYLPVNANTPIRRPLGDYLELCNSNEEFRSISDSGQNYISLIATEYFDLPLFASIAQFVVNNLQSNKFEDVIDTVESAVRNFHKMLKIATGETLQQSKLVGLWGELKTFGELMPRVGALALSGWRGPLLGRHDFVLPGASIEVKTSTTTAVKSVEIHGLSQLEPIPGKPLYLTLVQVAWDPNGSSVGDLVSGIGEQLSAVDRQDFEDRLAKVGADESYLAAAEEAKFSVHATSTFAVTDAFPRISNTLLESAYGVSVPISDVSYRLGLDGRPFTQLSEVDLT
jgi:hypothetical protein